MQMGDGMSNREGICCICHAGKEQLLWVKDAALCEECAGQIPWECKTARFSKGVGMDNKYAEKYILPRMSAAQLKAVGDFMMDNRTLTEAFHATHFIPESGMVVDVERKLFYFDVENARLSSSLKAALLSAEGPRVIMRAEWVEGFALDYAYYKTPHRDGSALYYPKYAQIVLRFRHPVLRNKSIRLDIERPALVEMMLRRYYREVAQTTLEMLQCLTGLQAGEESKTYYDA